MDWLRWLLGWLDPCNLWIYRSLRKRYISPPSWWLPLQRNLADAIEWQDQPAHPTNIYTPPTSASKLPWTSWSASQKAELDEAYREMYLWLECRARQLPIDAKGVTDRPVNLANNVAADQNRAHVQVAPEYMWKLYLAHVAFTLAAERLGLFPWRITSYSAHALRYLLDSTTMAWLAPGGFFWLGTSPSFVPAGRRDNLPATAFAPPTWLYPWLRDTGLVGTSTLDTIRRLLQWMRRNLVHFIGDASFGNMDAIWQYRGYPPISRIIGGTLDANNPGEGVRKWTAGCHGSVGFLCAVLRAANIPVQPVWICGHEAAHFITDDLYLDHGDNPYNSVVRSSPSPIDSLLIGRPTYQQWFGTNLAVNLTASAGPACANVGRAAREFV